jgi:ATP-dependent DNA helicase DinG
MSDAAGRLDAQGPFARELPGFTPRSGQQALAAAVERALQQCGELVAEAGTGTGKTFAYLVPALLSGLRVVISTGTRTLQDQLFQRDLPRVRQLLGSDAPVALLKGRSNYLCLHRLEQSRGDAELSSMEQVQQFQRIEAWAARTASGDRVELHELPEDAPIWVRVTSTQDNCLGSECPHYQDCYVVKARRAAQEAAVVVVNHHLLFADMALKSGGFGEILPGAEAFILDEAHQLAETAGQFFGTGVSSRQMEELARDSLREAAEVPGMLAALREPVEALMPAVRRLRLAFDGLPERGPWRDIEGREGVAGGLDALDQALENLAAALAAVADSSRGLASCAERAEIAALRLRALAEGAEGGAGALVRWYQLGLRGFVLHGTPLDVAEPLRAWREQSQAAWVFTSATLAVDGDFTHFNRQLGLAEPDTLLVPSPFDYGSNALLYLPPGLPDPGAQDFTDAVVEAALPLLEASGGRAFLLFTSHRALRRAAELLAGRTEFPLMVQGQAPRHLLLERFREAGNAVLLGAASFWEGVDVAGEALSLVLIDKLPFASPGDPVTEARLAHLREQGANPFSAWQVPSAVIALKQGAGRLIRSERDRGVLVLCDPRLLGKGYGRTFLHSLPPMPRTRELAEVAAFFSS